MKKMICKKSYTSSFFNLETPITHAKEGDLVTLTNQDLTFSYFINEHTQTKFYIPTIVMDRFFEEVE